jgi:pimeloyl-ACP methyl ester carboxylesterase
MSLTRLPSPHGRGRGARRVTRALQLAPWLFGLVAAWAFTVRFGEWSRAKHVLETFGAEQVAPVDGVVETVRTAPFAFATKADDVLRWAEIVPPAPRATLVLAHGVNYRGIAEPRLLRFARALAREGYAVYLPELPELADYRIDARSIDRVGLVAERAARASGRSVGVVGTSFAGGLSVMAAARPEYATAIRFVFSLGGHEDVDRVSRYLATGRAEDPTGTPCPVPPHDYGLLVLLHSHASRFFPPADVVPAEEALTAWLHEDRDVARRRLDDLHDAALRTRLSELMEHGVRGDFAAQVLSDLDAHREESKTVSPSAALPHLDRPLYLLHGTGDSVIPALETMYLARDAPLRVRRALVSPAIVHVEVGKGPGTWDRLELVDFLADVLHDAEAP